jgi:methylase of polypeptide subunit release factors
MIDCVLELIKSKNENTFTLSDIWTGTSCIPISILNNSNNISHTFVVDIMKQALEVSKVNIDRHKYSKVITQCHWSLLDPIIKLLKWNIIITANLPYILDNDFDHMDKETVEHEPDSALYWGPVTWFELYEKLIQQCLELKKSWNINEINLFIEIWFDQKEYSQKYLNNLWLKNIYHKDNWWIERCIHIVI